MVEKCRWNHHLHVLRPDRMGTAAACRHFPRDTPIGARPEGGDRRDATQPQTARLFTLLSAMVAQHCEHPVSDALALPQTEGRPILCTRTSSALWPPPPHPHHGDCARRGTYRDARHHVVDQPPGDTLLLCPSHKESRQVVGQLLLHPRQGRRVLPKTSPSCSASSPNSTASTKYNWLS